MIVPHLIENQKWSSNSIESFTEFYIQVGNTEVEWFQYKRLGATTHRGSSIILQFIAYRICLSRTTNQCIVQGIPDSNNWHWNAIVAIRMIVPQFVENRFDIVEIITPSYKIHVIRGILNSSNAYRAAYRGAIVLIRRTTYVTTLGEPRAILQCVLVEESCTNTSCEAFCFPGAFTASSKLATRFLQMRASDGGVKSCLLLEQSRTRTDQWVPCAGLIIAPIIQLLRNFSANVTLYRRVNYKMICSRAQYGKVWSSCISVLASTIRFN